MPKNILKMGRQVAQPVERRTLEDEVQGSKPILGTWCCDQIPLSGSGLSNLRSDYQEKTKTSWRSQLRSDMEKWRRMQ